MPTANRPLIYSLAAAGALTLTACEEVPPEQLVEDFGIAYIKRPVVSEIDTDTNQAVLVDRAVNEVLGAGEGGDIWYRDRASPSAPERNITFCLTQGLGDVRDLETSYDGGKIIFSLRLPDPDPNDDVEPTWDIYEYDTTSGDCPSRLIQSDIFAGEGDDLAPHYLPDGRIVFTSTRQKASGAVLTNEGKDRFRALDESMNEQAPLLHVMSASGTDIQQISFNQSHDLDPTVLSTGEILFTRWDHMGDRDAMNLYSVRPDGTELKLVYGAHDHGADDVQFLSPRQLEDGRVLAMLKPLDGTDGSGAPTLIDIANYADNTQPVWPQQGVLSGRAQRLAVDLDVRTDGSLSPNGRFRNVYPLWDGTNRVLASWSPCRLLDGSGTPRTCPSAIPADAVEALPIYGIYIINLSQQTQLPVVVPEEGWIIEEPVVAAPRREPAILYDRLAGFELDQTLAEEGVGLLHIRSVYDFDGRFNDLGSSAADITSLAELADPTLASADQRAARFLRIVKSVPIPDRDTLNFDRSAFGVSRQQKMREIIGYAPVQPDGSVLVKVPANVPFAISVVDKDGRRIGGRHQNWLQLRAGEALSCNGCHDHNPSDGSAPLPHGTADAPTPVNLGAPTSGMPFPGTDPAKLAEMGETMAQTRIRLACGASNALVACPELSPSVNLMFDDEWTDPAASPAPSVYLKYNDPELAFFGTSGPAKPACQTGWTANCRTIINYEAHIHPLWSQPRTAADGVTDRTCTSCHNSVDAASAPLVPAAQLDLGDGPSDLNADHFKAYRELLSADNRQIIVDGVLVDETMEVPVFDENGNQLFQTAIDPVTGEEVLVLDPVTGLPIPLVDLVPIRANGPSMSRNGSRFGSFMGKFLPGGSHEGDLSATELRLIAEWLDLGAQYYNDPFKAPLN
ncbi:MAG TPA: hypothetical protein ENJ17_02350 [Gammaproteobacteria bacterium]|nr:hypothetical protein [Gammaproteobacteria bacterium]